MMLKDYQVRVHKIAQEKGWFKGVDKKPSELHAAMKQELDEATQAHASHLPPIYKPIVQDGVPRQLLPEGEGYVESPVKPKGEAVQLAKVLVQIFNYAEHRGLDMDRAFNDLVEFYAKN